MESAPPLSYVIIACDATKDRAENKLTFNVDHIKSKGGILNPGDRLLVLGNRVPHPSKFFFWPMFLALDFAKGFN